jgi:phage-related protein
MSLETWSYIPQQQFTQTLTSAVTVIAPAPRAEIVGKLTDKILHEFKLRYTVVGSGEVNSMAAFFQARHGSFEAFLFRSPTDQRSYLVRFSESLTVEHFTPSFFRTNELTFTEVTS